MHCVQFLNIRVIFGEEFPTPKLKGHPLSVVCGCLFNLESKISKRKMTTKSPGSRNRVNFQKSFASKII
jgi:hypothetical protein